MKAPCEHTSPAQPSSKREKGDCLYIILNGYVLGDIPGGQKIKLGKGDVVGEMALLTDRPRNATVTIGDAATTVSRIERESVLSQSSVYRLVSRKLLAA